MGAEMSELSDLDKRHVLIVDDEESMRTLVRRMLTRLDPAALVEAEGAEQALERVKAASTPIDLVVCDWNMPGMSGIELFKHIRSMRLGLPFLMLTGRNDAGSVIETKRAGVPGYAVKPISPNELRRKVVH